MIRTSHAHIENHRGQAGANDTSKHISEGFKALAKEILPLGDRMAVDPRDNKAW